MELRPATLQEFDEFSRAALVAFHRDIDEAEIAHYRTVDEPERSLAWFHDGRIVATGGAYTRSITVPGAVVPVAAVTAITVAATHRRRGLLRGMMRRQLDELRDGGEVIAALWAAEAEIYGRFGYGEASAGVSMVARRPAARLRTPVERGEPLVAGPAADHVEAMRAVYERVRPTRPGLLDRRGGWWEFRLHDPPAQREGAAALRAVVTDGAYAMYAAKPSWSSEGPSGEVFVREAVAADPEAHARLWSFLLDLDLTTQVTWEHAPADDPLYLVLTNDRAAKRTVAEGLWVRLVDVPGALAARRYADEIDVVLEVTDAFCPWNDGRYRLTNDGCERTTVDADLAMEVDALASVYLGGPTLASLAAAGRVRELRPGTLIPASRAFRGDVVPWCPEIF